LRDVFLAEHVFIDQVTNLAGKIEEADVSHICCCSANNSHHRVMKLKRKMIDER